MRGRNQDGYKAVSQFSIYLVIFRGQNQQPRYSSIFLTFNTSKGFLENKPTTTKHRES